MNRIIDNSKECDSESIDCDSVCESERIMIRILEIGLIFEYLSTICIVTLLSSSIAFRNFKGLPPDILDRVLLESFNNSSLDSYSLAKLASSVSSTALKHSTSPITETLSLSDLESGDIVVTHVPDNPLTVADLKTGYLTVKKCKCCFDIDTVRIVKTNLVSDDDIDSDPLLANLVLNHVVEISVESTSDRNILLNHLATETTDGKYTICPSFCERCEGEKCEMCEYVDTCEQCYSSYCLKCGLIQLCDSCEVFVCRNCDQFNYCHKCDRVICDFCMEIESLRTLGRSGYCEMCNSFYCSHCDVVSFCEICEGTYCSKCLQVRFCEFCEMLKCANCETMVICSICYSSACMNCSSMLSCDECGLSACMSCIDKCSKCNKVSCRECSKTMKFTMSTSTCASCT